MRILAERTTGRNLKPGDLFSIMDQDYWDSIEERGSVGEAVYIRTNEPVDYFRDADDEIFRITILP